MKRVSTLAPASCGMLLPSVPRFRTVLRSQASVQHLGLRICKDPVAYGKIARVGVSRKDQRDQPCLR